MSSDAVTGPRDVLPGDGLRAAIASGGVGNLEHIYDGLTQGNASAALAASIFHYQEYSIAECKSYLHSRGIPVRLVR